MAASGELVERDHVSEKVSGFLRHKRRLPQKETEPSIYEAKPQLTVNLHTEQFFCDLGERCK
jgi:hypothetical protein